MVFASLPPWRSILLLLLSITILHVMSIPLPHGDNDVAKVQGTKIPIFLVRRRTENKSVQILSDSVQDKFSDEWIIYIGDKHGFVARRQCDDNYESPTWPWIASAAKRCRAKRNLKEILTYVILPTTREEIQILVDELLAIPPRARYHYLNDVMLSLWKKEIITEAILGKWEKRVKKNLDMETSELYVERTEKIKQEAKKAYELDQQRCL
ncbi:hypothetical protein J3R30DRAFT_3399851 [Lentinula aciculospora]|uniref:Uncharacterized protein n=1 Tax=Lentinula aciculospora TaxID=153920 RepID=A0A9W9AU26_9AGAR|nr:hypothetical protein J3R30DRAFT_3399848 [Lentinula aciculospora]KAJ4490534.1 hypothetical protein J3R30DRAFT_3399851 [Lentinula aciculospora]